MFLIRWEKRLEQFFRDTTANGTPVLLFWLLPSGRFLLWMLAMMCLANLVTTVPPLPIHFELYDLGLILYLAGIIKGELTEMHGDVRTYGHLRRCARSARRAPLPSPTPLVPCLPQHQSGLGVHASAQHGAPPARPNATRPHTKSGLGVHASAQHSASPARPNATRPHTKSGLGVHASAQYGAPPCPAGT